MYSFLCLTSQLEAFLLLYQWRWSGYWLSIKTSLSVSFSCILQLRFSTVDLELHTKYVPGGSESIYDVDRRVCEKTQVLPPLPQDKFLCSFSHIFAGGYAAGYYSYKVFCFFICWALLIFLGIVSFALCSILIFLYGRILCKWLEN